MNEPEIKNVVGIQFSIMGPDEIRNRSVVEITTHDTYDKDVPVVKGIFDSRMGVTDSGKVCATCGQKNIHCPGHFGHIELAKPIYNYHFINNLIKILKCVCFRCSKLLIDVDSLSDEVMNMSNENRFQHVYNLCGKCNLCGKHNIDGCGAPQPDTYKLDGLNGILAKWKKPIDESKIIDIEYIRQILERITDSDCEYLGFSNKWCRPEWLICEVMPVPPPCVRPSVKQDNSQRMDDDLTHKLVDIIKANNQLKRKIAENSRIEVVNDWTKLLQYHCATLIDNDIPGLSQAAHRSGRALKSIRQRLKGKEGRIRNNLMGKRVDFSARSVITPDPNIELDELGVPFKIANNLTYPERVNMYNIDRLKTMLKRGSSWPGIKTVNKRNIRITVMDTNYDTIELEYGDIVHRHLMDGDFVLFNRQPSLHKMSMMAHRVRVMDGNTFRLNISVTPPYNADFDGDEMNCHAPQSISSLIELREIVHVNRQIISVRENKPIITIVQDTLLGINLLTKSIPIRYIVPDSNRVMFIKNTNPVLIDNHGRKKPGNILEKRTENTMFTRSQMMNVICDLSTFGNPLPKPDITHKVGTTIIELWTGKSIFSYILPKIDLEMNNKLSEKKNDRYNYVVIVRGLLKQGALDKDLFTKTSKGMIHTIYNDFGSDRCKDFIDDLQKITNRFLIMEGFSVGISDMIAPDNVNRKIDNFIEKKKREIQEIIQEIHLNIFENYSGTSNKSYFESKVNNVLNKTLSETEKMGLSSLSYDNRALNMINCGSKGKPTNIAQMIACLGQQNVDGKRIPYGFEDRTLPHYYKYDDSSEARGFVENSFISGQTPQEYFFHAMGGREGLIDTAVKTSETGYIQRKLIKSMEDIKVNEDYTVRSSSNIIVQFLYGGDGIDATFVESQPLLLSNLDTEGLIEMFLIKSTYNWERVLDKKIIDEVNKDKDFHKKMSNNFKNILAIYDFVISKLFEDKIENNILFPVHIQRIIQNKCGIKRVTKKLSNISPIYIIETNERLKKRCFITRDYPGNRIFQILIDIHLSPKILIEKYKIQLEEYDDIIETIISKYYESIISPGELVGPIAAQSIGEPATQMTLNTFHYAGVSSKSNVTRGIPRLRELLHISKKIKSPSVKIYLRNDYIGDKDKCNYIKNKLEYMCLRDIIKSSEIYYDYKSIDSFETNIESDDEFMSIYREFESLESDDISTSPWIIRYVFDREIMLDKAITMEDVEIAINQYDRGNIKFIYSDENCKMLIGRVSIKIDDVEMDDSGLQDQSDIISTFKTINNDLLTNIIISGIENIRNIVMSEIKTTKRIDSEIKTVNEWLLETDGTNLLELFGNEFIDHTRTTSNDVVEMYETLGIEATRNLLINEITNVVEEQGEYINSRHIELLCDVMTSTGSLISINREGIKRGNIGPLAKCSFENTTDQLIKAGIFGELDNLNGVSSNIMMGQKINAGTNNCELLLDEEKLIGLLDNDDIDTINEVDETNIDVLINQTDLDVDGCDDDDFDFTV